MGDDAHRVNEKHSKSLRLSPTFVFFRGGRFINNVFVPSGSVPPREVRVRATFGGNPGVDGQGRTAWARIAGEGGEQQGAGWGVKFGSEDAGRPLRRSGR